MSCCAYQTVLLSQLSFADINMDGLDGVKAKTKFAKATDKVRAAMKSKRGSKRPQREGGSSKAKKARSSIRRKLKPCCPIIIVPASMSSMITLMNAKEFFQDGRFLEGSKKRSAGEKKPTTVKIKRKLSDGTLMSFKLIDSVHEVRRDEWERVACVVAHGASWQFKAWPREWSTTANIFRRAKGFHFRWSDVDASNLVQSWNVTKLTIHRTKRHFDKICVHEFWKAFEKFLFRHFAKFVNWAKVNAEVKSDASGEE